MTNEDVVDIVGVTELHQRAWDFVCVSKSLGKMSVDPFVGSAMPVKTDAEMRSMIGSKFRMSGWCISNDGCYLPDVFEPVGGAR